MFLVLFLVYFFYFILGVETVIYKKKKVKKNFKTKTKNKKHCKCFFEVLFSFQKHHF